MHGDTQTRKAMNLKVVDAENDNLIANKELTEQERNMLSVMVQQDRDVVLYVVKHDGEANHES